MKRTTLTIAIILVSFFWIPSSLMAVRAPDEIQQTLNADLNHRPIPSNLRTVLIRNINQSVAGDARAGSMAAAKDLLALDGFQTKVKNVQTDPLGFRHIRLALRYKGLPVIGAEIIVHVNQSDMIYQINGKCPPAPDLSVAPLITATAATQIGMHEHQGHVGVHVSKGPHLVIFGGQLAYHYVIAFQDVGRWQYFVNAHTGELISRLNNIHQAAPDAGAGQHQDVSGERLMGEDGASVTMTGFYEFAGSGNYFLYNFDDLWGVFDESENDWEQEASDDWGASDREAVSVGYNIALTQRWVSNVLGRNSYDDAGAFGRANVHATGYYCPVNAWWDGDDFHFCDGDDVSADSLVVLDVVAHEYGHAITEYTSNLAYSYEPGALNESFSDITGTAVEFTAQMDGSDVYPSAIPGYADWLLAEDAWLPDPGDALRDMRDPQRYSQPSYYQGTYWYNGVLDNGGVHTNSGVQNFAFYLLAEGGSGTNDGHAYGPITGIGVAAAAEVAMRANTVYMTSMSHYADAREAWISAAADFGYDTQTIEQVWDAVGVGGTEINLLSPENGAALQADTPATFSWEADAIYRFKMEFSPFPTFPTGIPTLTVPKDQNHWQSDVSTDTIPAAEWEKRWDIIRRMAQITGNVYWRILAKAGPTQPVVMSEIRHFTIYE